MFWKSNHTAVEKYSINTASELYIKVMNTTNLEWILNVNFRVFYLFFSDFVFPSFLKTFLIIVRRNTFLRGGGREMNVQILQNKNKK